MRARSRLLAVVLSLAAVFTSTLPALAADPYAADPLGIVAHADRGRTYSVGVDEWEVAVCRVPDGGVAVTPGQAVQIFEAQVRPYFEWLSGGLYSPRFQEGAVVDSPVSSNWPEDPFARQFDCEQRARTATSGNAEGLLLIVDAPYEGGYGTLGFACEDPGTSCPTRYPSNARIVVVGSGAVVPGGGVSRPRLMTIAHEIGHALAFPHSYGGLTTFQNGQFVWEYDNPMDVMSGGELLDLDVATIAFNRFAAGWIAPHDVRFHRGGTATYELSPPGFPGPQFLVLPTDLPGIFEVLGARSRTGYDSGIPAEGIEVYRIDQSGTICGVGADGACWGADRRTAQVPAVEGAEGTAHVFGVGTTFSLRTANVEVLAGTEGGYAVRVSGQVVSERFVDDNGSVHEADIAAIADLGIAFGCNAPINSRFCPSQAVTRAEMAAFLLRAIGDAGVPEGGGAGFSDVPDGEWYTPLVLRLAELGITTGYTDGTYRPDAPVSRAEMAVFLTRALPQLQPAATPTGAFADVPASAWFAPAVEGLAAAGVSRGCSTSRFCPYDAVLRDQMASFLARALP